MAYSRTWYRIWVEYRQFYEIENKQEPLPFQDKVSYCLSLSLLALCLHSQLKTAVSPFPHTSHLQRSDRGHLSGGWKCLAILTSHTAHVLQIFLFPSATKSTYFRFILLNFKILLQKSHLEHLWDSWYQAGLHATHTTLCVVQRGYFSGRYYDNCHKDCDAFSGYGMMFWTHLLEKSCGLRSIDIFKNLRTKLNGVTYKATVGLGFEWD